MCVEGFVPGVILLVQSVLKFKKCSRPKTRHGRTLKTHAHKTPHTRDDYWDTTHARDLVAILSLSHSLSLSISLSGTQNELLFVLLLDDGLCGQGWFREDRNWIRLLNDTHCARDRRGFRCGWGSGTGRFRWAGGWDSSRPEVTHETRRFVTRHFVSCCYGEEEVILLYSRHTRRDVSTSCSNCVKYRYHWGRFFGESIGRFTRVSWLCDFLSYSFSHTA